MATTTAGFTLAALAEQVGARLTGAADLLITGLATLHEAGPNDLTFLANPVYRKHLATTRAAAVILHPNMAADYGGNALIHNDPYLAYAQLSALFAPKLSAQPGIHPSAVVDPAARVEPDACIAANVVIERGAEIGASAIIGAGSYIGADTIVGAHTRLHPQVVLYHGVRIGARCILHSHVTVGSDGFGFARDRDNWLKIHQLGGVWIGDDVELGAATCVDRGALADTWIGDGVKTDNMVQIAHNVRIGPNTVIAGCSAIAGSTSIGANCMIAGKVGIVGHLQIADGVTITAMSLVTKSITEPGSYSSGTPLEPSAQWRKNAVRFGQLDSMSRRLKDLENKND